MLAMSETEIFEIDEQLNGKLEWAKQNTELAEQLAMDATRLMSCTNERLEDYKDKGFFKRCVSSFSGKTAKMQRDNQYDIVEMQKMGWRYLQMLNERDILMAHSLITIKNNLETLAVKEDETREEIARFAIRVKSRFDSLSNKVDELEVTVDIELWVNRVDVLDYNEKYPESMRLLCLVRDFRLIKSKNWNINDIHGLRKAIKNAGLNWKKEISLEEFVSNLIDEIEENSFEMFSEITALNDYNVQKIDTSFLVEEIASPTFNSLYQISDKYIHSDDSVEALKDELNIEKKDAIKKIILRFIKKSGVDVTKEIQLQDIALEILSCSKLAQELFEKNRPNAENEIKNKIELDNTKRIDYQENNTSKSTKNVELPNPLPDLELLLMAKKFAVGDDFGVLINNNDGLIKSFGKNINGSLGIGSNEHINTMITEGSLDHILNNMFSDNSLNPLNEAKLNNQFLNVIDLPKDVQCVSVDVGYRHSLALLENGSVYGWGCSSSGQLGSDTKDDRLSPFKVIGLPKNIQPVKIVAGANSSVVLLENGDLYATGKITNSLVFVPYQLDFKVKDVELLYDSSEHGIVLLKNDDSIIIEEINKYQSNLDWCDFDDARTCQPKGLHEDAIIKKIITGSNYLFVLTNDNTLYGIGQNKDGQLGLNNRLNTLKSFSKVYGLDGEILQVTTSHEIGSSWNEDQHFTLILTDKYIYGCGTNANFQLGKQDNYYETSYKKDKSYAKNIAIGAGAGALGGFIGSGIGAIIGATKTAIEDTKYEYTKHYSEMKAKNIKELSDLINNIDDIEIACGNRASYMYNFTTSKLYKMGGNYSYSDVEILDI